MDFEIPFARRKMEEEVISNDFEITRLGCDGEYSQEDSRAIAEEDATSALPGETKLICSGRQITDWEEL